MVLQVINSPTSQSCRKDGERWSPRESLCHMQCAHQLGGTVMPLSKSLMAKSQNKVWRSGVGLSHCLGAPGQRSCELTCSLLTQCVPRRKRCLFLMYTKMACGLEAPLIATFPSILPPCSAGRGEASSGLVLPTLASPVSSPPHSRAWFGTRSPTSSGPLGGTCWTVASSPRIK